MSQFVLIMCILILPTAMHFLPLWNHNSHSYLAFILHLNWLVTHHQDIYHHFFIPELFLNSWLAEFHHNFFLRMAHECCIFCALYFWSLYLNATWLSEIFLHHTFFCAELWRHFSIVTWQHWSLVGTRQASLRFPFKMKVAFFFFLPF